MVGKKGKRAKTEWLIRGWVKFNKNISIYWALPDTLRARRAAREYCDCDGLHI